MGRRKLEMRYKENLRERAWRVNRNWEGGGKVGPTASALIQKPPAGSRWQRKRATGKDFTQADEEEQLGRSGVSLGDRSLSALLLTPVLERSLFYAHNHILGLDEGSSVSPQKSV